MRMTVLYGVLLMFTLTGCNQGGSGANVLEALPSAEMQDNDVNIDPSTNDSGAGNEQFDFTTSELSGGHTSFTATIISDIHQLAPELRADNPVFETFLASGDGKLLKYSTELLEALKEALNTDILIVSGDLTTNGELRSHEWLANYFREIEAVDISDSKSESNNKKSGTESADSTGRHTRVYVIPGNHDVNNPYARTFVSGKQEVTDTVSAEDFARIYGDFGYDEALSRDPSSLSYVVRLADDFYLVMLDTCIYEDNISLGYPVTGGALRASTISWLRDVDAQIKALSPEGATIISSSHHNLLSHSPVHDRGFVIDNIQDGIDILDTLGIKLNFSGHIHTQDIISEGNITEIVTGSLLQYAQTYGVATFTAENIDYHTQWVNMEGYALSHHIEDPFLLNFKTSARAIFRENSVALIGNRVENNRTPAEIEAMKSVFADLNEAYFAGTDSENHEQIRASEGYMLWMKETEGFLKGYVESMLLDDSPDNQYSGEIR